LILNSKEADPQKNNKKKNKIWLGLIRIPKSKALSPEKYSTK